MFDHEEEVQVEAKLDYVIYSDNAIDVVLRNGEIKSVTSEHPNFDRLRTALVTDAQALSDAKVCEFVDFGFAIGQKLESLSDRVKFDGSNVFFDGDAVHTTLTEHILRMAKEKNPRLSALVKFMENVSQNPSEKSRNSLYDWILNLEKQDEKLTITKDGMILAYKGVSIDAEGVSRSIHSGPGIVDGVTMNCHLPNKEGSIVEISRSYVDADTAVGCSTGLHAGTWAYAHGFARGRTLIVEINPRDVVSVPDDCAFQKLRVSRYVVIKETDAPETLPVFHEAAEWSDEEIAEWEAAGYERLDAEDYQESGYSYEEALEIVEEESTDLDDWYDEGFDRDDVEYYRDRLGYTLDEAVASRESDEEEEYEEDDADDETAEERYTEWFNAGFNEAEADSWMGLGYSVEEALADIADSDETETDECDEEELLVVESFVEAFAPVAPKAGKKKNKKGKKNKK